MMYTQEWPGRKRERDDEEENGTSSFSEHRTVGLPPTSTRDPGIVPDADKL
jgi:hypothetical protein